MRYVILRDDDTNAFTPVECLERLYRPFLERGLPINLATIPEVATDTRVQGGELEGYLLPQRTGPKGQTQQSALFTQGEYGSECAELEASPRFGTEQGPGTSRTVLADSQISCVTNGPNANVVPIGSNPQLVSYLHNNPGYHVIQHGLHHNWLEFDRVPAIEVEGRLDRGTELLQEAGFQKPQTFVAPYDKLSRSSFAALAKRFRIISTGWYELKRLPASWWPKYFARKIRGRAHWQSGDTLLLSHPGCLLSCFRSYDRMFDVIQRQIESRTLTVLVTHWWEYFREGRANERFIGILHETAEYLANERGIRVISFSELAKMGLPR